MKVGWAWWLVGVVGCAGQDADDDTDASLDSDVDTDVDITQVPPEGGDAVEAWLAAGHYLDWACEPEPHPPRDGSAHDPNRICSNDVLSGATGSGPYPVGAAAVKELYDDEGAIYGYAVSRRVTADAGGDGWYWYERIGARVPADGRGDLGAAKVVCVSCHQGADEAGGRDLVFTRVP